MDSHELTLDGRVGPLAARLDVPDRPIGYAVLAHCFTCGKDLATTSRLARGLVTAGWGVLRIDFAGLGGSGGEFVADTTFSGDVDDLVRAADHLRGRGHAPALLVGHSLGGAAVLAAADRIPEVTAVATVGAPFSPTHVTAHVDTEHVDGGSSADGSVRVDIAGHRVTLGKQLLDDLDGHDPRARLAAFDRALLLLHSPDDDVVAFDEARAIRDAVGPRASLVALDGADHLLTRPADARRAAGLIAAWAEPFGTPATGADENAAGQTGTAGNGTTAGDRATAGDGTTAGDGATAGDGEPEPGTVVVSEDRTGPLRQTVRAPGLRWTADEPESAGGTGAGPDPYQLLLSALGACTSMTMRMYADRKGWDLRRATVTLNHDRIHAADCAECETSEGRLDRIVREIHLDGDLDDDQRARLLGIADRCPVHRTLHSEIVVETDEV